MNNLIVGKSSIKLILVIQGELSSLDGVPQIRGKLIGGKKCLLWVFIFLCQIKESISCHKDSH